MPGLSFHPTRSAYIYLACHSCQTCHSISVSQPRQCMYMYIYVLVNKCICLANNPSHTNFSPEFKLPITMHAQSYHPRLHKYRISLCGGGTVSPVSRTVSDMHSNLCIHVTRQIICLVFALITLHELTSCHTELWASFIVVHSFIISPLMVVLLTRPLQCQGFALFAVFVRFSSSLSPPQFSVPLV